ncbi:hypothetical protein BsWGS_03877 [Bradybaena similaris]
MKSRMATITDCTCPICLCIMIEPVTMPCRHSICFPCYQQTVEKANLCCPLCRLRISVWARKSAKAGTLVDSAKWDAIRKAFPVQVQQRLEGKELFDDDDDSESFEIRLRQLMAVSKPGEIREEYEAELQKIQRRRQEEAKMEEEASAALIRSLQQEEEKEKEALERLKEEQDRLDREIAEKLQETFVAEDGDDLMVELEVLTASVNTSDSSNKSLNKTAIIKISKGKSKQLKQTASNNLTMATFFSPVPRETDVTSHIHVDMTAKQLKGSQGDAGIASQIIHDMNSRENSRIPASNTEMFISSFLECLDHKLPSGGISVKDSTGSPSLEDHTAGGGVASRAMQKLETVDRFAAGPSGVGRCGTVISAAVSEVRTHIPTNTAHEIPDSKHAHTRQKLETVDRFAAGPSGVERCGSVISAAVSEVRTHIPTNTAHEIPDSKHAHTRWKPLGICSQVSSTQVSSYSVSDPLGKSVDNESTRTNTTHLGVASSKATSLETSIFNTDHERLYPCSSQFQTLDAESSSIQTASVLSHRNTFKDLSESFAESGMSSEDIKLESHHTLLADPRNIYSSLKGQTKTTCDSVKLAVDPASTSSLFNNPDDPLSESGDGAKNKCKDDVNYLRHVDVRANDNDTVGSIYDDTTEIDSDEKTCGSDDTTEIESDENKKCYSDDTIKNDSDTCTEFSEDFILSRQQTDCLASLGKHTKMCNVNSKFNSEKENRIGIDCNYYKDMKANSKIEDGHCVLNSTVFKVKTNSVKKSKKSAIVSMPRKEMEPVISIRRWCVPNGCDGEPENRLKIKKDAIFHKTEQEQRNSESVLSYFRKRKLPESSDDEEKQIFSDDKQINDVHSDSRKEIIAKKKNTFFSKKKLKVDSAINSLAPVRPEISAIEVLDQHCDDVAQSGMSQEERDHLMALRLQEMYSMLDKKAIPVDRFKGSKDHYMFRKKTTRK